MDGWSKTKVAVPEEPSLLRVSFTSGTLGSSTPFTNCNEAASQMRLLRSCRCRCRRPAVERPPAHVKWSRSHRQGAMMRQ